MEHATRERSLIIEAVYYRGFFVCNICLISRLSDSVCDQGRKISALNIENA